MSRRPERHDGRLSPGYDRIAKRIGFHLRDLYGAPEAEPLPMEHVDLLLKLRHRERETQRRVAAQTV